MRRYLLVSAVAAVAVLGLGGTASANHPCHQHEPCTGHTCIELRPPFLVPC